MGRHRSDAQVNSSPVTVLREHEEVASQWKHLQPGDLVKVCHATTMQGGPLAIHGQAKQPKQFESRGARGQHGAWLVH